jgi:transposase
MRKHKEVRDQVLSVPGRYRVVHPERTVKKDPSPLKVKDVLIDDRQYVVCINEEQVRKDAEDREAILAGLRAQLKQGDKSLVGNKGYRKYLKTVSKGFEIDERKVAAEARYDGKWVLRTNTGLRAEDVALKYKQLWMVESLFRTMKSVLSTRPIHHKRDETILGHVFCSFLSFVLMKELQNRVAQKGHDLEWADVIRDLERLEEVEIEQDGKRFLLRTEATGTCGKVFQAAGVALPPTVRQVTQRQVAL